MFTTCAERTGPGPDRLGLKCYLAWGGGEVGGWGGAKGPGPDPFGSARAWGVGRGVGGGGGAKGPGPDRLGFRPFRPGLGGGEGGGGGGVHFQKVPYLIVFNLKSQRTI